MSSSPYIDGRLRHQHLCQIVHVMHNPHSLAKWEIWLRGIVAAAISGGANGVVTGFAAIGIDPNHFNLSEGLHHTLSIASVSAGISAILGVALYLRQSPLPPTPNP
jgi:hypothetical protein